MEIRKILELELEKIKPEDECKIWKNTKQFCAILERALKKNKARADVFVGGSLAKGTIIRKESYDIDIFIRFFSDAKNISDILEKVLKSAKAQLSKLGIKSIERVHGSRDYFNLRGKKIIFEVIPVLKIRKPEQAKNITDLSALHVSYILGKIKKNKKLADEIKITKAFCYAQNCYGAESYINGFSGYALEVLVSYYGSFLNFLKAAIKQKEGEKIVLDPAKYYGKKDIMMELNEAKLSSPIIAVDPVHKERNVTAALSNETFARFKEGAKEFLAKPSSKLFETKHIEISKLKAEARKKKSDLVVFIAKTGKQRGDIACAKLRKFYEFLNSKLEKNFDVLKKEIEFHEDSAKYFFLLRQKKEIILSGPPIIKVENLFNFRKAHKNSFIKQGKAFAKEKPLSFAAWLEKFRKDFRNTIKEMEISKLEKV